MKATSEKKAQEPAMSKTRTSSLFYFYEISSRLDCGSTLQIINDYTHLSRERIEVILPIFSRNNDDKEALNKYTEKRKSNLLTLTHVRCRSKYVDRALMLKKLTQWLISARKRKRICVIREDKHLGIIRGMKFIFRFKLISELHEAGLPETSRSGKSNKYQNFLNNLDGIILTSKAQKNHIESKGFSLPANTVLPNGVEIKYFARAKISQSGEKIIAYTGMFNPWKNVPLLFKSLRFLPAEYKLRIAGGKMDSSKSLRYIQNLSIEHEVTNRVDFKGFVNREDLVDQVLDGSSVLAVPLDGSVDALYATSPMKLIEYLATKIPVVAVDAPSTRSIVTTEEAILCAAEPQSFAEAILTACEENQEKRISLANKLAEKYSHQVRAEKYSLWLSTTVTGQRKYVKHDSLN